MTKHRQIARTVTCGLVLAAVTVPTTAQAMPARGPLTRAATQAPSAATPDQGQQGFQWDDAGLGAAGAVVLLGAAGGLAAGTRRRRLHRAVAG
jgi:hypothetical protein